MRKSLGDMNSRSSFEYAMENNVYSYVKTLGATLLLSLSFYAFFESQTSTAADSMAPKAKLSILNKVDIVLLDLIHIVLIAVCVALLHRTAAGTKGSRFLRHIAYSYTITAVYYFGRILITGFKQFVLISASGLSDEAERLQEAAASIGNSWAAIDVMLSLFSSVWLILAWHLLTRYPNVGVTRTFYVGLVSIYATVIALLVAIMHVFKGETEGFVVLLDTGIAATAIVFVGLGLYLRMTPVGYKNVWLVSKIVRRSTFGCYVIWGSLQPVYAIYLLADKEPSAVYLGSLLLSKSACAILTVILCALSLPERPEYSTGHD